MHFSFWILQGSRRASVSDLPAYRLKLSLIGFAYGASEACTEQQFRETLILCDQFTPKCVMSLSK